MQGGPGCVTSASLVKLNQNHSEAEWAMLFAFCRQNLMPRQLFMPCPFAKCCSRNHRHQTHWGRHWAKYFTVVVKWVLETASQTSAYFVIQRKERRKGYSRRTPTIKLQSENFRSFHISQGFTVYIAAISPIFQAQTRKWVFLSVKTEPKLPKTHIAL